MFGNLRSSPSLSQLRMTNLAWEGRRGREAQKTPCKSHNTLFQQSLAPLKSGTPKREEEVQGGVGA